MNQLALSASVVPPSMSPLTSMAGLTSMPGVVNMANMVSMANASTMSNLSSMSNYSAANMANLSMLNTLGMAAASGLPAPLDAAALAKEVAQKNYAKAIKLSQASQPYGISQLTALNYTGVALNKQSLMNPGGAAAPGSGLPGSTGTPRPVIPGLAGIPGALTTPLPAGILAYSRPQPTATPINPYSLIRQQILPSPYVQASIPGAAAAAVQASSYVQNPYAVLPSMAGVPAGVAAAAGVTGVPQIPQIPNPATIAAQPQVAIPVSSGVIMQPYKKMKTS